LLRSHSDNDRLRATRDRRFLIDGHEYFPFLNERRRSGASGTNYPWLVRSAVEVRQRLRWMNITGHAQRDKSLLRFHIVSPAKQSGRPYGTARSQTVDKFQAMQAFIRVVESGTFTKAAQGLDLPKTAVSRLIASLEVELGTKLLNRTTRKVLTTADGAAYYERALQLMSDLTELEGTMSRAKTNPRGRLRVDLPVPLGLSVILPALPAFVERYPGTELEFGISDRPVDLIAENVDCVVRAGEIFDQSLIARQIGDVRQILCATPAYLDKHGRPSHPSDLEHGHVVIRTIASRTNRPFPIVVTKDRERVEVQNGRGLTANDIMACLTLGLAGLGVVHALTFSATTHLQSGAFEAVLNDWVSDPVFIAYQPNRHLSAKVRVFIDWLTELFASNESTAKGKRLSVAPPYG
jgi:DNA-binding transcriptional LysR family regulator